MSLGRRILPSALALLVWCTVPASAAAQARRGDGRVVGAVIDKSSGRPVPGATVVSLIDGKAITTDTAGVFRFEKLPTGIIRFLVRAEGFPAKGVVLALAQGELMERRIELDSTTTTTTAPITPDSSAQSARPGQRVQQLAPVLVEEAPSLGPRFANFERRRKTGAGQYVVREQIEKMGASNLQDVARTLRGVALDCGGGLGCSIRMVRAPMRCQPEYIVDDNVDNTFGPGIPVRDIEALEVYTGPADVPGEYAGRNAGCGVIVIWTRSGPARKRSR